MKLIRTLRTSPRRAQGMTEYIIIVGLIAIVLIAAIKKFQVALSGTYDQATIGVKSVGTDISSANSGGNKASIPSANSK